MSFRYSKRLLNLALALGCQPGVEIIGRQPLAFQKLYRLFRRPARGAVDHSARRPFGRQVRLDRDQDIGQLGGLLRGQHGKGQIGPQRPVVQQYQIHPKRIWRWSRMPRTTSGLAVAVRHGAGGT